MMIAVVAATEQGIVVESVIPIADSNTGDACVKSDNTVPDTSNEEITVVSVVMVASDITGISSAVMS
jgi:hypothetical protein